MNPKKQKIYRIIAAYLALNLFAQICWPTAAFALTNGPGQPEFQSFEPAGTSEMVNLFTGDFNYNIPLMTVPGPNGGYPINIAYHAGISMEQEASWVGLGWNINAGAINRSMRGLPDDFNGDQVVRELHYKPATTFSLAFGKAFPSPQITKERAGFTDIAYSLSSSINIYYSSYRGLGYGFDFGLSSIGSKRIPEGQKSSYAQSLSLNLSVNTDGVGVNVDNTTFKTGEEGSGGWFTKAGLSWGSRDGLQSISFGGGYGISNDKRNVPLGGGVAFSKSSYVPASTPEMTGFISMLGASLGQNANMKWKAAKLTSLNASLNKSWVKEPRQPLTAYGYMHAENSQAIAEENRMEDINREKDAPPSRQTKTLAVPTATYDVYSVSGQGVGGVFRPYRSDIGIYTEPNVTSTIRGGKLHFEYGTPDATVGSTTINWGLNGAYAQSRTSSGMWENVWWNNGSDNGWEGIEDYQFVGLDGAGSLSGDHLYEPFYFKMSGEQTAERYDQLDFLGDDAAVRLSMKEKFESGGGTDIAVRPEINAANLYSDTPGETPVDLSLQSNHRLSREKRIVSNQYRTNGMLDDFSSYPANIYSLVNSFPATGGIATPAAFDYAPYADHHIGEFTEVNPDGNRYVYGIPVYTTSKSVVFAKEGLDEIPDDYIHEYDPTTEKENTVDNEEPLTDQYFSSTSMPGYTTSHLLTQIYSPDYVDVTGDGPTEDDLGYYVKFNYVKTNSSYQWRAPYWGAIVNPGFLSNQRDDKLSYEYGQKDIYYLHSIETKTHVACFVMQSHERRDGHEAISENAQNDPTNQGLVSTADGLRVLDHISLYSKADPDYGTSSATPLKSSYFTYDYSSCPGVPNNENTWGSGSTGKLTLKSIYFTYRNNNKGQLSPYQFEYIDANDDADLQNPAYDPLGNDRWGNYKKQVSTAGHPYRNNENSYVDQLTANRYRVDQSAAAWCLKQITLPSGSQINIDYEADDYAYVQDQKAMQMCRVVGAGAGTNLAAMTDLITPLTNKIYFELNEAVASGTPASELEKYIGGIDEMYFKMFLLLKEHYTSSDPAWDYVEGYCKISHASGSFGFVSEGASPSRYGFVTVELVDRDDYPNVVSPAQAHPIQKAAWQHIYLDRPDLFNQSHDLENTSTVNLASVAQSMVFEIPRAVAPYMTAFARGWALHMDVNGSHDCDERPSYIRLNAPDGFKAGGGHRVKQLTITDAWDDLSGSTGIKGTYGLRYSYTKMNENGRIISSGVAAYEPMIGGEEIPLRMPIRFNSDNLVKKDAAFYMTEPMGESYYPAPVVGYSRVIVKSLVEGDDDPEGGDAVTISRSGQTSYEFYTAKDYPVIKDRTQLQKTWFPMPVFLPFIGSVTYNNRGFSQGYSIILNDMHGKLKSVSTYPYAENLNSPHPVPVRSVFYKYNGDYGGASRPNTLSSVVNVLTSDGVYSQQKLGETYDFFIDMRQHSNETMELGVQFNANTNITSGFTLPTFMPIINLSRSLYRSAVVMKVIYRTGILTDVITIDDGAKSSAHNLLFDGETGAPLLTTVENEFEKPVYTYNFAGHWSHEGMRGAYNNVGVTFNGESTGGGGIANILNADSYFFPGDEVMFIDPLTPANSRMLWVDAANSTDVAFIAADGSTTGAASLTGNFIITRSGHRNLQSVSNGVIVSLSDPTAGRDFPLFTQPIYGLNALSSLEEETPYHFTDCYTGLNVSYTLILTPMYNRIEILTEGDCRAFITFPDSYTFPGSISAFDGCDFTKHGNSVTVDFPTGPDVIAEWSDVNHCFNECLDNVLHAAATRFTDEWTMNFEDAGLAPAAGYNEYVWGEKGVWRTESNYLFQIDRKQTTTSPSSTSIEKDGTYENFVLYDWLTAAENNSRWAYVSQVSRYSPYGYALESRDALGIYSAGMYGYNNTKSVASASNCRYFEMAFDGFEDYGATYPVTDGHGHLLFSAVGGGSAPTISPTYSHTGNYSLAVAYNNEARFTTSVVGTYPVNQQYFAPQANTKYNLSFWTRTIGNGTPQVDIYDGTSTVSYSTDLSQSAIEGWKRVDVSFTAPASGTITIGFKCMRIGEIAYFDDIRLQPFTSAMVSNVYDPQTHWLLATLDNRNFATFYNYDEEGSLIQVKQETEKGVFTVKTARSNIQH
jgi:hypothetical protein